MVLDWEGVGKPRGPGRISPEVWEMEQLAHYPVSAFSPMGSDFREDGLSLKDLHFPAPSFRGHIRSLGRKFAFFFFF